MNKIKDIQVSYNVFKVLLDSALSYNKPACIGKTYKYACKYRDLDKDQRYILRNKIRNMLQYIRL